MHSGLAPGKDYSISSTCAFQGACRIKAYLVQIRTDFLRALLFAFHQPREPQQLTDAGWTEFFVLALYRLISLLVLEQPPYLQKTSAVRVRSLVKTVCDHRMGSQQYDGFACIRLLKVLYQSRKKAQLNAGPFSYLLLINASQCALSL